MDHDPTASAMREHLRQMAKSMGYESVDDASFDIEEAIYWFAADYHGGQWSNLYKALCRSPFKPGPTHNACSSEASYDMYHALITEFIGNNQQE